MFLILVTNISAYLYSLVVPYQFCDTIVDKRDTHPR